MSRKKFSWRASRADTQPPQFSIASYATVKVENRRVAKLAKSASYYYYFPDKSFLNYHNDSSTIPIAFIVKFWSTSIEVISSDTMKEDSLNYGKDLTSNWTPFL